MESINGQVILLLPTIIECNEIPDNRSQIPKSSVDLRYTHLKTIAHLIQEQEPKAPIIFLLDWDLIRIHKVRRQVNRLNNTPYNHKLDLVWVIVVNVCPRRMHESFSVNVFSMNAFERAHPTIFKPSPNISQANKRFGSNQTHRHPPRYLRKSVFDKEKGQQCYAVFQRAKEDNYLTPSIKDIVFVDGTEQE